MANIDGHDLFLRRIVRIWHIFSDWWKLRVKFRSHRLSRSMRNWKHAVSFHTYKRSECDRALFSVFFSNICHGVSSLIQSKNRFDRELFLFDSLNCFHDPLPRGVAALWIKLFLLKHDLSVWNLSHYLFYSNWMFYVFFLSCCRLLVFNVIFNQIAFNRFVSAAKAFVAQKI